MVVLGRRRKLYENGTMKSQRKRPSVGVNSSYIGLCCFLTCGIDWPLNNLFRQWSQSWHSGKHYDISTGISEPQDTHTHTHTHTHARTHTHTHVVFYGLRGLSIGVMVFILYKLYVLLPYTYPTPKLSPHRRRWCISIFPQKNSLCMIYKHFKLWGHWKCPHKSPSPCNTYVIPMSLYKFVSS